MTDTDLSLHVGGAHEVKWVSEADFINSDYKKSTLNKWLFTIDSDDKPKKYIFNEIDRYMINRLYRTNSYNFGDPEKNKYMVIDFDITLNEDIVGINRPTLCYFGSVNKLGQSQYMLLVTSEDGVKNNIKLIPNCNTPVSYTHLTLQTILLV